jgi:alpha-2-macroglobulin
MKTYKITFLRAATFVTLLFLLSHCGQKKQGSVDASLSIPAFHPAIAAFTSGTISTQSGIRVVLAEDYPEEIAPNAPVGKKIFRFKPDIPGDAFWVNNRTVEFRPAGVLPSSTIYEARFLLSELPAISKEAGNFDFSFRTIRQGFITEIEGLTAMTRSRDDFFSLSGLVRTADFVDPQIFDNLLEAKTAGISLPIRWEHESGGRLHRFEVDSIPRKQSAEKLSLQWDGSSMNIDIREKAEVEIPAKGDFRLLDVQVVQFPSQRIICRFSDPLDERQQLEGLVQLNATGELIINIDRNLLIIYPSSQQTETQTLRIEGSIRNFGGKRLDNPVSREIVFQPAKPQVRLPGKGVILPNSQGLIMPFEAISLRAVEVRVVKVYEENIPFFLQSNPLMARNELSRAGRLIPKKPSAWDLDSPLDLSRWNTLFARSRQPYRTRSRRHLPYRAGLQKNTFRLSCAEPEELPLQSELDAMDKADFEREAKAYDYRGSNYWYYDDYY